MIHSRPEFLYFWFYFVIVNGIWIVIPTIVIIRAFFKLMPAMDAAR